MSVYNLCFEQNKENKYYNFQLNRKLQYEFAFENAAC